MSAHPASIVKLLEQEFGPDAKVAVTVSQDLMRYENFFEARISMPATPLLRLHARVPEEDARKDDPLHVAELLLAHRLGGDATVGQLMFVDGYVYMWGGMSWTRMRDGGDAGLDRSPSVRARQERIAREHEEEARQIYEATRRRLLGE